MKKLSVAMVALVAMITGAYAAGTVTSVNVVGIYDVGIAEGGASGQFTFMTVPMTKLPLVRGTISAATATTISDSSAAWTAGAFAEGGSAAGEPGSSTYYVEITSGLHEGRHLYLSGNTATELTLAASLSDIGPAELVDQGYKIVAANRVRDVFGEPGGTIALLGGSDTASADTIQYWTGSAWSSPVYYNNDNPFEPSKENHWLKDEALADDDVIDRDECVLVRRSAGQGSTSVTVAGEVSANDQAVVLSSGFNLVGGMSAIDETIGASSLTNALAAGSDVASAGTVQSWSGAAWSSPAYFNNDNPFDPAKEDHWLQDDTVVDDTFSLESGQGYLINATTNTVWVRESPLK
jgi:hypothetical protein